MTASVPKSQVRPSKKKFLPCIHGKENFVEYHSFPELKEGMSDKGKQK